MMTWIRLKLRSLLDNLLTATPRQGKDNYNTTPSCLREAYYGWTIGKARHILAKHIAKLTLQLT